MPPGGRLVRGRGLFKHAADRQAAGNPTRTPVALYGVVGAELVRLAGSRTPGAVLGLYLLDG
jgi:hypothetical protein